MIIYIILLISITILIFISSLFSGSETAYTSIDEVTLLRLTREKKIKEDDKKFWQKNNSLIPSMLVGNNIINITATSLVTVFAIHFAANNSFISESVMVTLTTALFTCILIIFGEILPKTLATVNAEIIIPYLIYFMKLCYFIFKPITILMNKITGFIIKRIMPKRLNVSERRAVLASLDDITSIINLGHKEGIIKESTRNLLTGVIDFRSKTVEDIMIPRVDMDCIEADTPVEEILSLAIESGHSRFPVYEETVDHIIGILHTKSILKDYFNHKKHKSEKAIDYNIMLPYFVPETKPINRLFTEMQKQKLQMVIAIDEYGGTAGLVSMEDIIEEIMGDIEDESDKEPDFITHRGKRSIVNGLAPIEEVNNYLKINLSPHDEYQTIAGYILDILGHIPDTNERFTLEGYNGRIRKMEDRRIVEIEFTKGKKSRNSKNI